jgi:predicted enzyme related to lactoylglutathione lyase
MLSNAMTTTMLPVTDMDRASEFYETKLGLHHRATGVDGSRIFDAGNGDAIGLLPAEAGAQTRHTALSFEVATMGNERAAWFCDTEGNILCIHEVTNGG